MNDDCICLFSNRVYCILSRLESLWIWPCKYCFQPRTSIDNNTPESATEPPTRYPYTPTWGNGSLTLPYTDQSTEMPINSRHMHHTTVTDLYLLSFGCEIFFLQDLKDNKTKFTPWLKEGNSGNQTPWNGWCHNTPLYPRSSPSNAIPSCNGRHHILLYIGGANDAWHRCPTHWTRHTVHKSHLMKPCQPRRKY